MNLHLELLCVDILYVYFKKYHPYWKSSSLHIYNDPNLVQFVRNQSRKYIHFT